MPKPALGVVTRKRYFLANGQHRFGGILYGTSRRACGRLCIHRKKINISIVMTGQKLGFTELDGRIWRVNFLRHDLGYIDSEQRALQTIDKPSGTRLSPMS
ncbi:putative insertion sequence transposase protein [Rhizobium etli CFN 42]|uniref:Insertion sequence transposase protein n=1 Tax=Rhizobium etli (strain ATCC 51251 / DSM 11541 / JCM 21823 / NBRC 15573 / CFN 42) TaxID=347834 RepID=Q2K360_RHIEC|nr:putative insertion sequence transposase protein [Rhizobium etli CFN 42]